MPMKNDADHLHHDYTLEGYQNTIMTPNYINPQHAYNFGLDLHQNRRPYEDPTKRWDVRSPSTHRFCGECDEGYIGIISASNSAIGEGLISSLVHIIFIEFCPCAHENSLGHASHCLQYFHVLLPHRLYEMWIIISLIIKRLNCMFCKLRNAQRMNTEHLYHFLRL